MGGGGMSAGWPAPQRQAARAAAGRATRSSSSRVVVVRCAGKGKAAGRRGGGGGGGGGKREQAEKEAAAAATPRGRALRMAQFKADETLLFEPVVAGREALQVGGWGWVEGGRSGAAGRPVRARALPTLAGSAPPLPPPIPLQVIYAYPNEYTVGITSLGERAGAAGAKHPPATTHTHARAHATLQATSWFGPFSRRGPTSRCTACSPTRRTTSPPPPTCW